jgi:hypothetical protein
MKAMPVGPPKAGGEWRYSPSYPAALLPEYLLTKANPPKGGDAKLRNYRSEIGIRDFEPR